MSKVGVEVMTWGTGSYSPDDPEYTGMSQFIDTALWGGNVGHAAFKMTLPNTAENLAMVKEKLAGTGIPWRPKTYETKVVEIDKQTNKPTVTDKTAYKENVIEVYFSYWPSAESDKTGFSFNEYNEDTSSERAGVDIEYKPEWKEYLQPEERRSSNGMLSQFTAPKMITLDMQRLAHLTGLSDIEKSVIINQQKCFTINDQLSSIEFVINRLGEKKKGLKEGEEKPLSPTEKSLIKKFFPEESVDAKFDAAKIQAVVDRLSAMRTDLQRGSQYAMYDYIHTLITYNGGLAQAKKDIEMSETEKEIYRKVSTVRDLNRKLMGLDPKDAKNLEKINEIIQSHEAYKSKAVSVYSKGVTNEEQYKKLMSALSRELDPDHPAGLIGQNKGAVRKGDLAKVYESIENIEALKQLQVKLDQFTKSSGDPLKEQQARKELLEVMQAIADGPKNDTHDLCKRFLPWKYDESKKARELDDAQFLLDTVKDRLDPMNPDKNAFDAYTRAFNATGCEALKVITDQKAEALFQAAISTGHPPSGVVNLPLEEKAKGRPGLDPKAMLDEMAKMVTEAKEQGKKFNLVNNNCSVSTSRILSAGAGERGAIFEQAAFSNSVFNPQVVHNNAMQYSGSLSTKMMPEQPGYYQAMQNYLAQSFIYRAAGVMDSNKSYASRLYDFSVGGTTGTMAATMATASYVAGAISGYIWPKASQPQAQTDDKRKEMVSFSQGHHTPQKTKVDDQKVLTHKAETQKQKEVQAEDTSTKKPSHS